MAKVFVNSKIWQWGTATAQWMRVDDAGKIVQVGSGSPTASSEREAAQEEVVDLGGALVLPGLHDAHMHAYFLGESAEFLNLADCSSFDDFSDRLRNYDAMYPQKAWIVGFGWEQDKLSRYPSRHDLDAVVADRPVILHRACWHIAVANTKALEIAGIDVHSSEPHVLASGAIDVDSCGATGILREAAVEMVTKHINETSKGTVGVSFFCHGKRNDG
jgi:predicted amidohydrolase YtcJ